MPDDVVYMLAASLTMSLLLSDSDLLPWLAFELRHIPRDVWGRNIFSEGFRPWQEMLFDTDADLFLQIQHVLTHDTFISIPSGSCSTQGVRQHSFFISTC